MHLIALKASLIYKLWPYVNTHTACIPNYLLGRLFQSPKWFNIVSGITGCQPSIIM